jgi:hypothetical protein
MIWGSILGQYGLGELLIIPDLKFLLTVKGSSMLWNSDSDRVTSKTYFDYILPLAVSYIYEGQELTFQQDNASTHTAKLTRLTLSYYSIDPMPWRANSPNLNPLETI